jgi:hypothetical protein
MQAEFAHTQIELRSRLKSFRAGLLPHTLGSAIEPDSDLFGQLQKDYWF